MIDTKWLMSGSAALMFLLGAGATFMPHEMIARAGAEPTPLLVLAFQALGALYLGFAVLDWMARTNRIGGIYGRPIALGNFLHFAVLALALVRAVIDANRTAPVIVLAALYAAFAVGFAIVLFNPAPPATASRGE